MVIKVKRQKLSQEEIIKFIEKFEICLTNKKIPFKEIILFGSYAKGYADIDSDVDLAVIVPSEILPSERKKLDLIPWIAKQIHPKLEPHIVSSDDMDNYYLSIVGEIKRAKVSH